ncbi:reverse transcriptase (RNA-dependent DNA polymerase) domain-containing protein [Phthorimaea operculella]|nr:reverse transcriptase (RNA-dependent DNA polymerase) domain-containing protein [Phthorimaea operculella]
MQPRKRWTTKEILDAIKARNLYRMSTVAGDDKRYRHFRNKVETLCDEEKSKWIERKCADIERFLSTGQIEQGYRIIKQLQEKHKIKSTVIRNKKGDLLYDSDDITERWIEYIEELYWGEDLGEDCLEDEPQEEDNKGPRITWDEFVKALKSLSDKKAPGKDDIPAELFKYCGTNTKKQLYNIICTCYETGNLPEDFCTSKTIFLPKKGNATECNNYRTISLLTHVSKILLKIIQLRLNNKIEENLSEDQFGFRKNRGTREAIIALRLIIERRLELNKNTYIGFIDLEKAFDNVDWTRLFKILKDKNVDWKDRRVIYQLYKRQMTEVTINNSSKKGTIKKGVRQGCCLSPLLFNLYIEEAINEIREKTEGVKFNGIHIHWIRFADDIALIAESKEQLQSNMNIMNTIFQNYKLKINVSKTKVLVTAKNNNPKLNVKLDNLLIQQVKKFTYLGSIIEEAGRSDMEIRTRIAIAKKAFTSNRYIYSSKIGINIRKKLIKTYIWSVALYGSESWNITKKDKDHLEAFEMWCWRRMLKISWREKVTNVEVLERAKEKRNIIRTIENRRANCFGHVLRHHNLITQIIEGKLEGKRERGRPRTTYIQTIKEWSCSESYQKLKKTTFDRDKWWLLQRRGHRP